MSAGAELALIIALGVGSLWVADRIKVPALLLLLASGVVVGPVTGLVEPRTLFGELLFPGVAIAVSLLLFEGGLGLRWSRLTAGRGVVVRLVTIGVGVTLVVGALFANLLLPVDSDVALIIAAIAVVSGPTVVIPLVEQIRPREPAASILRWEGILIDPVGAMLAIVVLEAIVEGSSGAGSVAAAIATTVGAGVLVGGVFAGLLVLALDRHWVADRLQTPVTLMLVVTAYEVGNLFRPEAGLFVTTVMGVVLANQKRVPVGHIARFGEEIGQLILAGLFVVLGAIVDVGHIGDILLPAVLFSIALILVARPLAVVASTAGSALTGRERIFLSTIAPRGIVAASVAAVFALSLEDAGEESVELLPIVFTVIVVTVGFCALAARPIANRLRLVRAEPRAVAIVGGDTWLRDLASTLSNQEVPVLMVAPSQFEAGLAAEDGLLTFVGRLESEDFADAVEAAGVRQALVATSLDEYNTLAVGRLVDLLGRANVYRLPVEEVERGPAVEAMAWGRRPFRGDVIRRDLERAYSAGARFATVSGTEWRELARAADAARAQDAAEAVAAERDGAPEPVVSGDGAAGSAPLALVRISEGGAPSIIDSQGAHGDEAGSVVLLRPPARDREKAEATAEG